MKLGIVTHTVSKGDGQGRVNYEVAQEALRRGHHVTLVSSSIAPELQQHTHVTWIPIHVKQYPSALFREIAFALKSAVWLRQHRDQLDLVQVNGAITTVRSDVNAVHFVHQAWLKSAFHTSRFRKGIYGLYQWFYTMLNARWELSAFRRAKVIIAVSAKVKQELLEIGIAPESIQVILNGVDTQEFHPGSGDRAALGLPTTCAIALFVGDIRTPRKNLDTVLRALVQVPDLHLAVVGDLEGSPYPALAEMLGISQRIHFLNYRRDVAEIMRSVDFFVFPARYEPFGMVIIEAMASGLPILTTLKTGASEVITPDCGIIVTDSEDVEDLAQEINRLISHPQRCHQMGLAARHIAEQYSWTTTAQKYLCLFEKLTATA